MPSCELESTQQNPAETKSYLKLQHDVQQLLEIQQMQQARLQVPSRDGRNSHHGNPHLHLLPLLPPPIEFRRPLVLRAHVIRSVQSAGMHNRHVGIEAFGNNLQTEFEELRVKKCKGEKETTTKEPHRLLKTANTPSPVRVKLRLLRLNVQETSLPFQTRARR